MLEKWLRTSLDKLLPLVSNVAGANHAADLVTNLLVTGVRLFFAKKLTTASLWTLPKGFATGKPNESKLDALLEAWARHVQKSFPDSSLIADLGFKAEANLDVEGEEFTFDCSPEKNALPAGSSSSAPLPKFQTGDIVALLRRSSWPCPTKANIEHRKDINVGAQLKVMGVDTASGLPLVQATVTDNGAPRFLVHTVKSSDLQHYDAYLKEKALKDGETAVKAPHAPEKQLTPKGFDWLNAHIKEENRTSVSVVDWKKFMAQGSVPDALVDLQSEAIFAMNMLRQSAPQYTEKDLVVAHRSSEKADAPHTVEVWTNRAFKAFELVLVPYTHEIKSHYYTRMRSVIVRTSNAVKTSVGGKTLAVDGRVRSDFVEPVAPQHSDEKAKDRRIGSLFFCVQRTQKKKESNLILSYIKPHLNLSVTWPNKTKAQTTQLSDIVEIPIFTNPSAIPEHTHLVGMDDMVLVDIVKKQDEAKAKRIAAEAKGPPAKKGRAE